MTGDGTLPGTGWGVVQAFSTYDLWHRPVRRSDALEQQAMRVISGRTEAFDRKVRDLLAV